MSKQLEFNLSPFNNDCCNILDRLQACITLDLTYLSGQQLDKLLKLKQEHESAVKAITKFKRYVSRVRMLGLYDSHDLKLYQVYYHLMDKVHVGHEDSYSLFEEFCSLEFNYFTRELLPEELDSYKGWWEFVEYIGDTSKFYFRDVCLGSFMDDFLSYNAPNLYDNMYIDYYTTEEEDGIIISLDSYHEIVEDIAQNADTEEGFEEMVEQIAEDLSNLTLLYREYSDRIRDSFTALQYIEDFKSRQVYIFKLWLNTVKY